MNRSTTVSFLVLILFAYCKSSKLTTASYPEAVVPNESDSIYQEILKERISDAEGRGISRPKQGAGQSESFSIVPIYFGTDRNPSGKLGPYEYFSDDKGNGELHFGKCLVTVPKLHTLGEIERPQWWEIEFSEDASKHMTLKEVKEFSRQGFLNELHSSCETAGKKEAVVFIHGYNVSFDEAVFRSAQLVYDLSFQGVPILYSWPSDGGMMSYIVDGDRNEWTTSHLEKFLTMMATEGGFEKISVIAHSMGNRAFARALAEIGEDYKDQKLFDQIVLAAPDIDTDIFMQDVVPNIKSIANNITIYASSNDKALLLSKELHKNPRLGEGGKYLTVIAGIESVDASSIDTDFLGHSYFSNTWLLINDIYKLVNKGMRADQRGLKSSLKSNLKYWMLQ